MISVTIEDAEFICAIKQNKEKTKCLSKVDGTVESQKEMLKSYKKREEDKKEFYFVIEPKTVDNLGL